MTNILKQAPLFTTEASNTNCRLIRLNFLPSIRVSTLKSAKLKRIPFPLNLIGKHESMESRGSFTISWFIILNKNGCNMQMIMFYSNICMNSNVLKLLLKYLIENYTIIISSKRSLNCTHNYFLWFHILVKLILWCAIHIDKNNIFLHI